MENKSWLSCNILYVLSLIVVVTWSIVTLTILVALFGIISTANVDLTVIMSFYGQLSTLTAGTVLSYYFSSTQGSKLKDQTIQDLSKTPLT